MNTEREIFLRELKVSGLQRKIPNISETTAQFLHFLLRTKQAKRVLEIGCANGYSTIWLADAIEPFQGKIVSYEISEPSYIEALGNFKKAKVENSIELHLADANELLEKKIESFDVIFIDGWKKQYHLFWAIAKKLLAPNGLVIVDDVIKFKHKTAEFDAAIEQEEDFEYCVMPVDGDDGIMLIQKSWNV